MRSLLLAVFCTAFVLTSNAADVVRYARVRSQAKVSFADNSMVLEETIVFNRLPCIQGGVDGVAGSFCDVRISPAAIDCANGSAVEAPGMKVMALSEGEVSASTWVPEDADSARAHRSESRGYYALRIDFKSAPPTEFVFKCSLLLGNAGSFQQLRLVYVSDLECPDLIPPLFYEDDRYLITFDLGKEWHLLLEKGPQSVRRLGSMTWNVRDAAETVFNLRRASSQRE